MRRSRLALLHHWLTAALVVAGIVCSAADAANAALADCHDATCRITTADGSRGTGCVFEIAQDRVYVLTAAHVVGSHRQVECEFWRDGHGSRPIVGQVIGRSEQADAAIVQLDQRAFAGLLPKVIPLASRDYVARPDETVTSVGCSRGAWSTGFQGHVLREQGDDLLFVPTPANGRSGSAIFDAKGQQIVGLLRARSGDDSYGIATSVQAIYAAFDVATQCGPDGCPIGEPTSPYRLSPYRQNQGQRDGIQNQRIGRLESVWPTLPQYTPPAAPAMGPVTVDLSQTNGKIDNLTDKVDELIDELRSRHEAAPQPIAPPMETPRPPPQAAALEKAALENDVKATKEETSKLRQAVNTLIGDRETLRERFDARLAKVKEELGNDAGKAEIARAYVKDLVAEKLSGGAGWTLGKLLGAGLGMSGPLSLAIAGGLWFVSRRIGGKIQSGEPLVIERLFGRLGDKLDDLRDRIDGDAPRKTTGRGKTSR